MSDGQAKVVASGAASETETNDAMADNLIFVTYADGAFEQNLASTAWFAKTFCKARRTLTLTRRDLEANAIYPPHRDVFDCARGAGSWAWKPWASLPAMDISQPGDIIFYQDCGFGPRYKQFLRPVKLMALARERGFLAGVRCPQYGPNRRWIRRRCLDIIGANQADVLDSITVQATLSFWTNTPAARAFVETWLAYCLNLEAIRDARPDEIVQEDADFVEHRHDQAILTCLVTLNHAPALDIEPTTLDFAKSATMLELDLRARENWFYAGVLGVITKAAQWRRRARGKC